MGSNTKRIEKYREGVAKGEKKLENKAQKSKVIHKTIQKQPVRDFKVPGSILAKNMSAVKLQVLKLSY